MAEFTSDLRGLPRAEAWAHIVAQSESVLEGIHDPIAAMATMSCLVHQALGFLWVGFYRVVEPTKLRVGPYQGTLGCLEIAFGRGVCGTAAAEKCTILVPDVHTFAGHIACDSRSVCEVVVPVFDGAGKLIAVFDVDSERAGGIGPDDAVGAQQLVAWFRRPLDPLPG